MAECVVFCVILLVVLVLIILVLDYLRYPSCPHYL